MKPRKLILSTLSHYKGVNIATALGIAITTAVICGALIVGSSLRYSLVEIVKNRLGMTTHTLTSGERIFSGELAGNFNEKTGILTASVLKSEAVITISDRNLNLENVQIWGIDNDFFNFSNSKVKGIIPSFGNAVISKSISEKLNLKNEDEIILRIKHVGAISASTPFVSKENSIISKRVKVIISDNDFLSRFNLRNSQSEPYNVYVDRSWLNEIMENDNAANLILLNAEKADVSDIQNAFRGSAELEDFNLKSEKSGNKKIITSQRVFIDDYTGNTIKSQLTAVSSYLTYFVNSISFKENATPYSFITATEKSGFEISDEEIVINSWLADDLKVNKGDSLTIKYFVFGSLKTLTEKEVKLKVAAVLPMSLSEKDRILMPHLPGLSDAGNCRDWKTDIPIDLKKIRDKDEQYWNIYKGTPKAYITLKKGRELWQNQYGSLTTLIYDETAITSVKAENIIKSSLNIFNTEFKINNVKEEGLKSANSSVDFGQLFAGLGMFIIFSGLLLTVLLFRLSLKRRKSQIELFYALGFTEKLISKILFTEIAIISVAGGIIGMFLSLANTKLIFAGLNKIWFDIVRTDMLSMHFDALTIVYGTFTGIITGAITVYLSIRFKSKKQIRPNKIRKLFSGFITLVPAVILIAYLLISGKTDDLTGWFTAGILVLISITSFFYTYLAKDKKESNHSLNVYSLGVRNLKRNISGSLTVFLLLALGTFAIIVTAANRKDKPYDISNKSSGTGGFDYVAESTIPVPKNLNSPQIKVETGIPDGVQFTQFLSAYDDDASCLNLNTISNPRILAVNPENLKDRFSLVKGLDGKPAWSDLNTKRGDLVPAIADMTVIKWGLGKNIGDTLTYTNDKGEKVRLQLVAALANSIFQGNVIISEQNFVKHFNEKGGSDFILIQNENNKSQLDEELKFIFKDYGWSVISSAKKLSEFNSIENTYLNIFFLMGAFAMLLGTAGLAVIIFGSLLERKKETAMLLALGYSKRLISKLYKSEYLFLFFSGLLTGLLTGIISTLPTLLSGNHTVSTTFIAIVTGVLIINGMFWIQLATSISIFRSDFTDTLHYD